MRNIVLTSDKRLWLLRGFLHQWNKYYNAPITVAGFSKPEIELPSNAEFLSIGSFSSYPVIRWSNALIDLLNKIQDEEVLIMLEDYWLCRKVNRKIIEFASHLMAELPHDFLRFDVTTDRLYSAKVRQFMYVDDFDIIEAEWSDYNFSYQASIWNRRKLLNVLQPDETPWQSELWGNNRIKEAAKEFRVLGTRQFPMNYAIMVSNGNFSWDTSWMRPVRSLDTRDIEELKKEYKQDGIDL